MGSYQLVGDGATEAAPFCYAPDDGRCRSRGDASAAAASWGHAKEGTGVRVLVESRPKFPIPQEQFPALLEAFAGWRERHRPIMEAFWFFSDGAGGGGIVTAPDDEALAQMFLEYPF